MDLRQQISIKSFLGLHSALASMVRLMEARDVEVVEGKGMGGIADISGFDGYCCTDKGKAFLFAVSIGRSTGSGWLEDDGITNDGGGGTTGIRHLGGTRGEPSSSDPRLLQRMS